MISSQEIKAKSRETYHEKLGTKRFYRNKPTLLAKKDVMLNLVQHLNEIPDQVRNDRFHFLVLSSHFSLISEYPSVR